MTPLEQLIVGGLVTILVALVSGGLAVERYKTKQKRAEEREQGESQYRIARMQDSAAVVDKLLPQLDKLLAIEQTLIEEKLAAGKALSILDRELAQAKMDLVDEEEGHKVTQRLLAAAEFNVTELKADNEQLAIKLEKLDQEFRNISFNNEPH